MLILPACGLPADDESSGDRPRTSPARARRAARRHDVHRRSRRARDAGVGVDGPRGRPDLGAPVRARTARTRGVVAALLAGTTADDPPGVRSAWIDADQVGEVTVAAGTASVELTDRFADVPASDQLFAVAPDGVHADRPTGDRPGQIRPRRRTGQPPCRRRQHVARPRVTRRLPRAGRAVTTPVTGTVLGT